MVNCHCSQCRRALGAPYATLAGFDPESLEVTKGQENLASFTTGREQRFSCKVCHSKVRKGVATHDFFNIILYACDSSPPLSQVYAHLHHLQHVAIYNDNFVTPNHGPDGQLAFRPGLHIFYTRSNIMEAVIFSYSRTYFFIYLNILRLFPSRHFAQRQHECQGWSSKVC